MTKARKSRNELLITKGKLYTTIDRWIDRQINTFFIRMLLLTVFSIENLLKEFSIYYL
jgi:hypothetical protein